MVKQSIYGQELRYVKTKKSREDPKNEPYYLGLFFNTEQAVEDIVNNEVLLNPNL